jgi:hypothetical protein
MFYFLRSFAISANGANGKSDIEGKAAREAVSEWATSEFQLGESGLEIGDNANRGSGRHGREYGVMGSRRIDGKAARLRERE